MTTSVVIPVTRSTGRTLLDTEADSNDDGFDESDIDLSMGTATFNWI
jgi:hypothetical protein